MSHIFRLWFVLLNILNDGVIFLFVWVMMIYLSFALCQYPTTFNLCYDIDSTTCFNFDYANHETMILNQSLSLTNELQETVPEIAGSFALQVRTMWNQKYEKFSYLKMKEHTETTLARSIWNISSSSALTSPRSISQRLIIKRISFNLSGDFTFTVSCNRWAK